MTTGDKAVTAEKAQVGIAHALVAAQSAMGRALKQSDNNHFRSKYADLGNVMDACMPALNEAGIAVIQLTGGEDGHWFVETKFIHSDSGESISCRVPLIINKNDMQGYGSAVTYARRYGLMAMAGIAPEDDDGNAAAKAAPMTGALNTSFSDGVLDSLPEGASEEQKAQAFADAIAKDFKGKGEKALQNRWDKHSKIIDRLRKFPDMHASVVDAYETAMMEITGNFSEAAQ